MHQSLFRFVVNFVVIFFTMEMCVISVFPVRSSMILTSIVEELTRERYLNRWLGGWMYGWAEEWMDGWMDGKMDE